MIKTSSSLALKCRLDQESMLSLRKDPLKLINKSEKDGGEENGEGGEKHQGVFILFFFYIALWEV
jgi:hypothetical protein